MNNTELRILRILGPILLVGAIGSTSFATFDILTIGDSLTSGKSSSVERASYRPYLWQSIQNYLQENSSGLQVDFVGSATGGNDGSVIPAGDPGTAADGNQPQSVIGYDAGSGKVSNAINPAWASDAEHFSFPGASSSTLASMIDTELTNYSSSNPIEVAVIMLGTNDLREGNIGGANINDGSNNPLSGSVTTVGNINSIVDSLVMHNPSIEVLVAGLPPTAERGSVTQNQLYGWNEENRFVNGNSQDIVEWDSSASKYVVATNPNHADPNANNENGGHANANDVIDVLNDLLEDYAVNGTHSGNVTYVDPFAANLRLWDVDTGGQNPVLVGDDATDTLDPTRLDTVGDNVNDDLIDGLHLNYTGDQWYAAAIFEGLLPTLSPAANAASVPEPGSFLFFGMVTVVGGVRRRFFRR